MSTDKVTIGMELDRSQVKAEVQAHASDMGAIKASSAAAEKAIVGADGKARDATGRFVAMGKAGTEAFGAVGKSGTEAFSTIGLGALQADRLIGKAIQAAYALDAAMKKIAEQRRMLGQEYNTDQLKLGELAGQINDGVNDQAFVVAQANFARKALMRQDTALNYRKAFNDSGAQFVGKTIPGTAKDPNAGSRKFELDSARLATAMKLDPDAVGNLMGTISGLKNYKSPEEALGVGYSSLAILQGGSGDTAHLAKEQKKLLASLYGDDATRSVTSSTDEIAAMTSIAAEFAPGQESENARAAVRALRDFKSDKTGPLLKEAGITAGDTPVQAMRKLKPIVEAKAKAEGVKPLDILGANLEDITGATALAGYFNKGIAGGLFDSRMALAAGSGPEAAMERIGKFEKSGPGVTLAGITGKEQQKTIMGAQYAAVEQARELAENKLRAEGRLDTTFNNFLDNTIGATPFEFGGRWTKEFMIDEEARKIIRESAPPGSTEKRSTFAELTNPDGDMMSPESDNRRKELDTLIGRVNAAGGDALQSLVESMTKQNALLEKNNTLMERQAGGNAPAPLPPPPPPARR